MLHCYMKCYEKLIYLQKCMPAFLLLLVWLACTSHAIHVRLKSFESVGGFGCAVGPRHHAWQGSRHRGPRRCQGLDPCSGQISKFALRQNCAIEMFEGEFRCRFDDNIWIYLTLWSRSARDSSKFSSTAVMHLVSFLHPKLICSAPSFHCKLCC